MEVPQVSKGQLKYLQSLKLKKYRQKYGSFLVEGRKAVKEILIDNLLIIKSLYALDEWLGQHQDIYKAKNTAIYRVDERGLKSISSQMVPDQVILECEIPAYTPPDPSSGWVLFLDGIRDPGNLGTIIRSADWFGVRHIVMAPGTVDCYNPKCIQSTMGSIARCQLSWYSFAELIGLVPGHTIILADANAKPVTSWSPVSRAILVIGSESHGISPEYYTYPHTAVAIPKAPGSQAESLNAAMACTVLLALLTTQRD